VALASRTSPPTSTAWIRRSAREEVKYIIVDRGASPRRTPIAVARGGPVPRSAPAGAPLARLGLRAVRGNEY
jgi:hypothetical protein